MLKVGITGGIGSGKSLVCRVFEILKVPVYYADAEARKLNNTHPLIRKELKKHFGEDIYLDEKTLDRKKLAGIVFHDKEALKKLNSIVHPVVREHFALWLEKHQDAPYVVQEAAILFESGLYKKLDQVIMVSASLDLRIRRVMERDSVEREEVLARINNQMSEEEKESLSDYIIRNEEDCLLLPQILKIHNCLLKKSV